MASRRSCAVKSRIAPDLARLKRRDERTKVRQTCGRNGCRTAPRRPRGSPRVHAAGGSPSTYEPRCAYRSHSGQPHRGHAPRPGTLAPHRGQPHRGQALWRRTASRGQKTPRPDTLGPHPRLAPGGRTPQAECLVPDAARHSGIAPSSRSPWPHSTGRVPGPGFFRRHPDPVM